MTNPGGRLRTAGELHGQWRTRGEVVLEAVNASAYLVRVCHRGRDLGGFAPPLLHSVRIPVTKGAPAGSSSPSWSRPTQR